MTASDPDFAAMQSAVAAMKALPQSDPRNWLRFSDIHRNFCPHGNWYFLPWHRAYILSFERFAASCRASATSRCRTGTGPRIASSRRRSRPATAAPIRCFTHAQASHGSALPTTWSASR